MTDHYTVPARPALLRRAARLLDQEARALAAAFRAPVSLEWESDQAKKDHDNYRTTAKELRKAAHV